MYDSQMFTQLALVCFGATLAIAVTVAAGMYGAWRTSPEGRLKRARVQRQRFKARQERLDADRLRRALDADRQMRAERQARMDKEIRSYERD